MVEGVEIISLNSKNRHDDKCKCIPKSLYETLTFTLTCVELEVAVTSVGPVLFHIQVLVVPKTKNNTIIQCIIGTNLIRLCNGNTPEDEQEGDSVCTGVLKVCL